MADEIDDHMRELVLERRIQNAAPFQNRDGLQFNLGSFCRGRCPPRLARASGEIARRFVNPNIEHRWTGWVSSAPQVIRARTFENRQNLISIAAINAGWIADAEVFGR